MTIQKTTIDFLKKELLNINITNQVLKVFCKNKPYLTDFYNLSLIRPNFHTEFLDKLLEEPSFKFPVSFELKSTEQAMKMDDSKLAKDRFRQRLTNIQIQSKDLELEKGINTFSFGFPIILRYDDEKERLIAAPLIIWNLKLSKLNSLNSFQIERFEDSPISINQVLLKYLEEKTKVKIGTYFDEILETGFLSRENLREICLEFLKLINGKVDGILESSFYNYLSRCHKMEDEENLLEDFEKSNETVIRFSGVFSVFEKSKEAIFNDYDKLCNYINLNGDLSFSADNEFKPMLSNENDPSQQKIVNALQKNGSLIIQGPPGTGKSTVLTSILVNFLDNLKTVLVVCEKQTALEVLKVQLEKLGLGEFVVLINDCTKDRRSVVDLARKKIEDLYTKGLPNQLDYERSRISPNEIVSKIQSKSENLAKLILENTNWTGLVGKYLTLKRVTGENRKEIDVSSFESSNFRDTLDFLKLGEKLYREYQEVEACSFIRDNKYLELDKFQFKRELDSFFRVLKERFQKEKDFEYQAVEIAKRAANDFGLIYNDLSSNLNEVKTICARHLDNPDFFKEEINEAGLFNKFFGSEKREALKADRINLKQYFSKINEIHGRHFEEISFVFGENLSKNVTLFLSYPERNELEKIFVEKKIFETREKNDLEIFEYILHEGWLKGISNRNDLMPQLEAIFQKKEEYDGDIKNPYSIEREWVYFLDSASPIQRDLINELAYTKHWSENFELSFYDKTLSLQDYKNLPDSDLDILELDSILRLLKPKQLEQIKQKWRFKLNDVKQSFESKNPGYSIENLFSKKSSKKTTKLSLRKIINFDKELFSSLFPIVLITPEESSNLFSGYYKYFDLVMFDEASQLKLEDTLPALMKGKQVVISGDEHQMPPSNFFKSNASYIDDEEDEETSLETEMFKTTIIDSESLLEYASKNKYDKRFLDFHYRSKHPFLIDFSNHAFYDKRMKSMPITKDYIPIQYYFVDGISQNRTNQVEAEKVISILCDEIFADKEGQYPSVGIATFNIDQRNLILALIEEQKSKDSIFNQKMTELEAKGWFVKTIENIQGDERDVIIISSTYGRDAKGNFRQSFGLINQEKGYRLLNVLITRAKDKIFICSSIPEKYLFGYKNEIQAIKENNKKGVFYAYLAYCKAVSDGDSALQSDILKFLYETNCKDEHFQNIDEGLLESPFEEEVYFQLSKYFDVTRIKLQEKCSGFRIDMVYYPENGPKVAIECDGAMFHSGEDAFLHDLHRQKILEKHGYVFHRIWSTNWWQNEKLEVKRLVEFILSQEKKHLLNNSLVPELVE